MKHPVSLFGVYKSELTDSLALEVLNSGQIASGAFVTKFANDFGQLVEQKYVVAVNDMSNAIQIALRLSDVLPGDEVLTTSYACMSTNAPIATSGAKPVWVDVDPMNGLMDPNAMERAITPHTKAVIVYHVAGYPAPIARIAQICKMHKLKLIEDCDNALLATVNGQQVGTFGDFAIYSFYPNRQINATEGGALCCRLAEDAERAIRLRRYGIDLKQFRDASGEINAQCDIPEIGWAATLNNLCSAIGYAQLPGVSDRVKRARQVAAIYDEQILTLDGVESVEPLADSTPSYWAYLVRIRNRDLVLAKLKESGIQVSKLHYRNDLYSGFKVEPVVLPHTERFTEHVMALPCGWWMTDNDVSKVLSTLEAIIKEVHTDDIITPVD
jgi:perosamine synthetase